MIPDPDAEKPDDWDEEMDGDWEAPLIDNPECKAAPGCGTWKVRRLLCLSTFSHSFLVLLLILRMYNSLPPPEY